MANPEHVALVRQGADAIADWRQEHPGELLDLRAAGLSQADFRGADLSRVFLTGADLSGADLRGANLQETNLSGADLRGANLQETNLSGADLTGARLGFANLRGANLSRAFLIAADLGAANLSAANLSGVFLMSANLFLADLSDTNLSDAKLKWANLDKANLGGARLPQASLGYTSLGSLDLSKVRGLPDVLHNDPSSIGVDTLIASYRGAGNKLTPELTTFFRGAGVPKELLDALPKIVSEIKYCDSFLCYGEPDRKLARRLSEDLRARGASCWWHPKSKTVGERTWPEITKERRRADKMIVLCSAKALVRDGVLEEIEDQINEDPDKLVPISLDDLWKARGFRVQRGDRDLKPFLMDKNYADFANDSYEEALEELLKGLRWPAVKKPRRKKG